MSFPEHHFLFDRAQWSRGGARELWRNHMHRAPLEREAHVALHQEVSIVPVPDRHTVQKVLTIHEPVEGDYIATLHSLIGAIDVASQLHFHPDERSLAELTMSALERQIPFIRQGLIIGLTRG
jgi:hypothetical protein